MRIRQRLCASVRFGFQKCTRVYARKCTGKPRLPTVENGIKTCMYPGYPELYMQLNKKNEFHYQPDWYRGIEYPKEQERGYDFNEDLYVPGYFEVDIKKGESIVFSAGYFRNIPRRLKQTFEAEVAETYAT